MTGRDKTVSVTEFKAKCLSLMDEVHARKVVRLNVKKRGKPHVVISAPAPHAAKKKHTMFGSLKGSVIIPEGFDLTKPIFDDEIDAEKGILHR